MKKIILFGAIAVITFLCFNQTQKSYKSNKQYTKNTSGTYEIMLMKDPGVTGG